MDELSSSNRSKPDPSSEDTLSTFRSPMFVIFPSDTLSEVAVRVVKVPAPALDPPIVVPSIAPLSISTFVRF